jgi:hypothetical protein
MPRGVRSRLRRWAGGRHRPCGCHCVEGPGRVDQVSAQAALHPALRGIIGPAVRRQDSQDHAVVGAVLPGTGPW